VFNFANVERVFDGDEKRRKNGGSLYKEKYNRVVIV